jgi:hypothetical protein
MAEKCVTETGVSNPSYFSLDNLEHATWGFVGHLICRETEISHRNVHTYEHF